MRQGESGQMAVELALVLPVIFIVLVIAVDCLVFVSECARFDNIAAQKTLALAVSPKKENNEAGARVEAVRKALGKEFDHAGETVEVSARDVGGLASHVVVYDFELSMAPWPLGGGSAVFGTRAPTSLKHSYQFAFDPYVPGRL